MSKEYCAPDIFLKTGSVLTFTQNLHTLTQSKLFQ